MSTRIRTHTNHQLSDLGRMLSVWPQRVRDPSQFWQQFDALAKGIWMRRLQPICSGCNVAYGSCCVVTD